MSIDIPIHPQPKRTLLDKLFPPLYRIKCLEARMNRQDNITMPAIRKSAGEHKDHFTRATVFTFRRLDRLERELKLDPIAPTFADKVPVTTEVTE